MSWSESRQTAVTHRTNVAWTSLANKVLVAPSHAHRSGLSVEQQQQRRGGCDRDRVGAGPEVFTVWSRQNTGPALCPGLRCPPAAATPYVAVSILIHESEITLKTEFSVALHSFQVCVATGGPWLPQQGRRGPWGASLGPGITASIVGEGVCVCVCVCVCVSIVRDYW